MAWLMLLVPSAMTGALCAAFIKKSWGVYVAGGLPWCGLFAALIYAVYLAPDADGGDGFWIIALLFGGGVAAVTGVIAFRMARKLLSA